MEQAIIALVSLSVAVTFYLDRGRRAALEKLEDRLGERFEKVEQKVDERFEKLEQTVPWPPIQHAAFPIAILPSPLLPERL